MHKQADLCGYDPVTEDENHSGGDPDEMIFAEAQSVLGQD